MNEISDEQWQAFDTQGYVRLGKIGPAEMVQAMRQRIDEIMLGCLLYTSPSPRD